MFTGQQIVGEFRRMGITHVVFLPDSTLGLWEEAMNDADDIEVVRVCREGEAWAIAAGLYLGGKQPLVMIQCTGLFESGDALRNVVHDYKLPLFGVIGYRSYLSQASIPGDTCLTFTEPILKAWNLDYCFIDTPEKLNMMADHYQSCQQSDQPGIALIAEGKA